MSAPSSSEFKVVLITGGAKRIGAAIARELHAAGMNLILHYRNSVADAEALRQQLETQRPYSVKLLQADLSNVGHFVVMMDQARELFGRLDVLVNNASTFYPTPLGSTTEAQWEDLLSINLKAPYFLSQAAAPLLRATKGTIVNLIDIHAERPLKGHPVYSMAKAGKAMMVKALARELGPEVRVNGVAPGAILWPEQGLTDEAKATILDRTTLKRPGTPEDIARTVLFLVRDAAYISGQIIAVDGGRTTQQ